jgi:sugar lactone lactonase YvrE
MTAKQVAAGVVSVLVLGLVVAAVAFGAGEALPKSQLTSGSAWFPTPSQGSIALIDGSTGTRVARVDNVANAGDAITVEQSGSSALVANPNKGTVSEVDGATWKPGAPLQVSQAGDDKLAVHVGGSTAWVVSQGATLVQQLDPASMSTIGLPQSLASPVTDAVVTSEGQLWVTTQNGDLRSFADGEQRTEAKLEGSGHFALALVGDQPVAVDLGSGTASVINTGKGTAGSSACLDVPVDPTPLVGGSTADASWLLAVAPSAGTLVVSDLATGSCKVVALGPTAPSSSPRYGAPVEKGRFVFVPDMVTGEVIVIDPAAPAAQQVKARIPLGLTNTTISLLSKDQHVYFDDVKGEQAGVITDDLHAKITSKTSAGSPDAHTPETAPPSSGGGGGSTVASTVPNGGNGTSGPPTADQSAAGGGTSGPASAKQAGIVPPGPDAPLPPDNGVLADQTATTTTTTTAPPPPGSGSQQNAAAPPPMPDFSITPNPAVTELPVTFKDTTSGTHTVVMWTAQDATPATSTAPTYMPTFATTGSKNVTLTVAGPDGAALTKMRTVMVNSVPKVPDIQGMTPSGASAALASAGLHLGNKTATVDSVLPSGVIVDSNPPAGTAVASGTAVDYRDSTGIGNITTPVGPGTGLNQVMSPGRLAADGQGNIYIADWGNNQVKKLAPNGSISLIAGVQGSGSFGGDGGPATGAHFNGPIAVALDAQGNIYIADELNYRVRRVDHATGIITTVAGNGSSSTSPAAAGNALSTNVHPTDLFIDSGGTVWISARWQHQVLELNPATSTLSILPDPGNQLTDPASLQFDSNGTMYIAEPHANHIVRRDGTQFTVVVGMTGQSGYNGDGMAGLATELHDPDSIRFDGLGNLYFVDWGNNRVRRWSPAADRVATVAGGGTSTADGVPADQAMLRIDNSCCSSGLAFDSNGDLLFSDLTNNKIRRVSITP